MPLLLLGLLSNGSRGGEQRAAAVRRGNLLPLPTRLSCKCLRLLLLPAKEQGDGERWTNSEMGDWGRGDETRAGEEDDAWASEWNGAERA